MKLLRVALTTFFVSFLASLAVPSRTVAQLDHLLCSRMTDPLQVSAALDLQAQMQPEFNQQGCMLGKPFQFCVPATKSNVQPPPTSPNIVGEPLKNDYICYLVKCPKPTVPDRTVADQFGQRLQRNYKPFSVCVPAQKAAPPCGPTTSARQCGGTCDQPGKVCHFDKTASPPCTCGGTSQECEGSKPDAAGQCGGTCPPMETCLLTLTGTKAGCHCGPLPPPGCDGSNPDAAGVCGGSCLNPNDQCVLSTTQGHCICQPVEPSCVPGSAAGQCTGACSTDPNFVCAIDPLTNQCRCAPPPQNCGPNPVTGQCGGICTTPAGAICHFIPNTAGSPAHCGCQ
jgi:hypothetical protein